MVYSLIYLQIKRLIGFVATNTNNNDVEKLFSARLESDLPFNLRSITVDNLV